MLLEKKKKSSNLKIHKWLKLLCYLGRAKQAQPTLIKHSKNTLESCHLACFWILRVSWVGHTAPSAPPHGYVVSWCYLWTLLFPSIFPFDNDEPGVSDRVLPTSHFPSGHCCDSVDSKKTASPFSPALKSDREHRGNDPLSPPLHQRRKT